MTKLSIADAKRLLVHYADRTQENETEDRKKEAELIVGPGGLDGHPLAAVQAGLSIKESEMTLREYRQQLDEYSLRPKIRYRYLSGLLSRNKVLISLSVIICCNFSDTLLTCGSRINMWLRNWDNIAAPRIRLRAP